MVQRVEGTGYNYLGFNTKVGPLADVRVRQAISHLIHREGIVQRVLNGIGSPGVGPVPRHYLGTTMMYIGTITALIRLRNCWLRPVMDLATSS